MCCKQKTGSRGGGLSYGLLILSSLVWSCFLLRKIRSKTLVIGYGEDGIGDDNDVWRMEIEGGKKGDKLETLRSVVRVRHHFLKCLLTCTHEAFPSEWGFGQHEIACSPWQRQTKEGHGWRMRSWFVEENNVTVTTDNQRVPVTSLGLGFWKKLIESHKMMFVINSKLGADEIAKGDWLDMSKQIPIKWPLNLVSQVFSPKEPRTILLGNPRIWILHLLVLILFPLFLFRRLIKSRDVTMVDMFKISKNSGRKHLQVRDGNWHGAIYCLGAASISKIQN